jgi:hypothetical protein
MNHATVRVLVGAWLALTFAACRARAEQPPLAAPPAPEGMEQLFNGTDLAGWDGDPRLWSARDGVIHGETTPEQVAKGNTFLVWQGGDVGDFELRLSFRCNATNNSGVQYRSKRITDDKAPNAWVVRGYQHEIRNEHKFPNVPGFIYDEGGAAGGRQRICQVGEQATWKPEGKQVAAALVDQDEFTKLMKIDDWNDIVIIARGNRIRHYLNGRLILDFTDEHPGALSQGVIALQLHAGAPMWAEYKDIRLKRL